MNTLTGSKVKMDTSAINVISEDEREEGEIVDEFDVISDCSMSISPIPSPLPCGKLLAPPEFLPIISLSSDISDGDDDYNHQNRLLSIYSRYPPKKRRRCRSRNSNHSRRRKKRVRSYSKTSINPDDFVSHSENERLDTKRKLLTKALRRESQEILHNSLRTRLKNMLFNDAEQQTSDSEDLEALRSIALLSRNKDTDNNETKEKLEKDIKNDLVSVVENDLNESSTSLVVTDEVDCENYSEIRDSAQNSDAADNNDDSELMNLRLDALKSAVLKKCKVRKHRKLQESEKTLSKSFENLNIPDDVIQFDEFDKENNCNTNDNLENPYCSSEIVLKDLETKDSEIIDKKELSNNNEVSKNHNIEHQIKKPENISIEEDVDILRAMLLASISTTITNKNVETETIAEKNNIIITKQPIFKSKTEISEKQLVNSLSLTNNTNSFINSTANIFKKTDVNKIEPVNANSNQNLNYNNLNSLKWKKTVSSNIEVKPLIINVNDSDTEEESFESQSVKFDINATVENFLKKQRAEVEARDQLISQNKYVGIKNNGNINVPVSEIKNSTQIERNVKPKINSLSPQKIKICYNNSTTISNSSKSKLDQSLNELLHNKSALKLLSKSQQLEYQKLKQRLLNAKVKTKKALNSQPFSHKKESISSKSLNTNTKFNGGQKLFKSKVEAKKRVITEEKALAALADLKRILDQVQVQKNGRLQMKSKYKPLVPLLRKVNQASNERRQNEGDIKRLLSELQEARAKLANSHQNFFSFVQQLVINKESLDKSANIDQLLLTKVKVTTSTPVKSGNFVSIDAPICNVDVTAQNLNSHNTDLLLNEKQLYNPEQKIVHNKNENTYFNGIESVDRNDTLPVFIQTDVKKSTLDYVSLLGKNDSESNEDPLKVLCPYDLFGVCKDKECSYRHCSRQLDNADLKDLFKMQ